MDFIDGLPKSKDMSESVYGSHIQTSWSTRFHCTTHNTRSPVTPSSYHPQTNGHTKGLNRCLETYLRCFCSEEATDWHSYLYMAEYWYNTFFHSAIKTTPCEALYGRPPPQHLPYLPGESTSADVDNTLINRELKLQLSQASRTRKNDRVREDEKVKAAKMWFMNATGRLRMRRGK
uniref:Integrase catalytic domain-containing protein n=2 Tax=Nicotiana TaxID=4085 RepID=A0A1S3ZVQ2_TOBAC|nr:PREDICTED: uncharacterized protein LOC104212348 [Nicotiana sylvestris]XP_016468398.1 PREDICTED: uncharacterized protein LOC107790936 [Nicotiana tabacum]